MRPREKWRTFAVPLTVSSEDEWRLNRADGSIATWTDLEETLAKLRGIRIQAEFAEDSIVERTDLDDVRIWDAKDGAARHDQLKRVAP